MTNIRHLPAPGSRQPGPSRLEKLRYLKLWGHDCVRCGETIPLGERSYCKCCGQQNAMVPLFYIPSDWPEL